jgi:hypothetical protein
MTKRSTIPDELHGLGSTLANISPQNFYEVPDGYFEGLANQILNRVKALDASNAKDELEFLSPALSSIAKEMPFTVPIDYFENLSEKLMQGIREHADYQTSDEEIASLSPLLNSISKKNPYHAPAGYFENLKTPGIRKKEQTKIISIVTRKWRRFAVAAVLVGFITISGILLFSKGVDPNKNPQAWVEKNIEKKVSRQQLDEFVNLAKEDENLNNLNDNDIIKSEEIKALMKDVPEKEIREFLNEAVALESHDAADILLN